LGWLNLKADAVVVRLDVFLPEQAGQLWVGAAGYGVSAGAAFEFCADWRRGRLGCLHDQ